MQSKLRGQRSSSYAAEFLISPIDGDFLFQVVTENNRRVAIRIVGGIDECYGPLPRSVDDSIARLYVASVRSSSAFEIQPIFGDRG
jgi:hypothetical protein